MTLALEDGNSKLLGVVSVADVDAEERVDGSLVEILKLSFGRYFEPFFVTIMKVKFVQDFEVYFWLNV